MIQTLLPLNPVTIPLDTICLIEASAGTGKTYTIGSIYLRLLLQAGENCFSRPLNIDEILVVTFTEMATDELKRKIRERIIDAKRRFLAYQTTKDLSIFAHDEFLLRLLPSLTDLDAAVRRLTLAEQNMDLAAIFTIHGFCRRMLTQYAFHSGVHFNLELVNDQRALIYQFANEFWRRHFYPLPFELAAYIADNLVSPQNVAEGLMPYIGRTLEPEISQPALLTLSLHDFLQRYIGPQQTLIRRLKQIWLAHKSDITALIVTEMQTDYDAKTPKRLSRTRFRSLDVATERLQNVTTWAENAADFSLNTVLADYFTQSALNQFAGKGAEPLHHDAFEQIDRIIAQIQPSDLLQKVILYHYLNGINCALIEYQCNHQQKGFDDLLRLLEEALYQAQGEELAALIRAQYPVAMIDEFQDTDALQYRIFSKIYRNHEAESGLMMIGDPKQAIYRFRGADIFTYLHAAKQADQRFNLAKNYRSEQHLVAGVNALFDFDNSPFIYKSIQFHPVSARPDHPRFYLNRRLEPAYRFYLTENADKSAYANTCAVSIQQWLKSAVKNQCVFKNEQMEIPLKAENIAVLVRNYTEADLIKTALQRLGIASVYLSDNGNVFDSQMAKELIFILRACLESTERHILNAIATSMFNLTAAEINQIRYSESQWQTWSDNFIKYRRLWQRQGVLPMLHQLILSQQIPQKLFSRASGERHLTDLMHLAELLQEAANLHENEAALLRWFEKQVQGEGRQDAQIRLESERQLVKIITIHKSKGLEYDLVWLPFLGIAAKDPLGRSKYRAGISTYYDEKREQILWDMEARHNDLFTREILAEELRLLYVALTRAKYQMAFALPPQFEKKWNPLLYVLTQGTIGQNATLSQNNEVRPLLEAFQAKLADGVVMIESAHELEESAPLKSPPSSYSYAAEPFYGDIEQDWHMTSFTAMERYHRFQHSFSTNEYESAVENDLIFGNDKDYDTTEGLLDKKHNKQIDETPILIFPQGAYVGTLLHRYFEKNAFSDWADEKKVLKLCRALQLDENFVGPIRYWLEQILTTPLFSDNSLNLRQIKEKDCQKEMPFYLAIYRHFNVEAFNSALRQYHRLPSEPLQFEQIQGMLRGTIDLVFRHQGKYYLIDYKSNFLGDSAQDYHPDRLDSIMLKNHYDWQYLLYSVALHRYLSMRDKHYDYEHHFGGVIYAFLRGMDGTSHNGLYRDKPDYALIQALEALFYVESAQ